MHSIKNWSVFNLRLSELVWCSSNTLWLVCQYLLDFQLKIINDGNSQRTNYKSVSKLLNDLKNLGVTIRQDFLKIRCWTNFPIVLKRNYLRVKLKCKQIFHFAKKKVQLPQNKTWLNFNALQLLKQTIFHADAIFLGHLEETVSQIGETKKISTKTVA